MTGQELIAALGLRPHPEGGWYRRTWEAPAEAGRRPMGSAIYYLLLEGEEARRHRTDATELWHHYAGSPLALTLEVGGAPEQHLLGDDLAAGQRPQVVVPAGTWQRARPLGPYTLAGATVVPAFTFARWELDRP